MTEWSVSASPHNVEARTKREGGRLDLVDGDVLGRFYVALRGFGDKNVVGDGFEVNKRLKRHV